MFFNPYEKMKPKVKKSYDDQNHFLYMYNILQSMFTVAGLPDTLPKELVEGMFITQGICPVGKIGGELYTGTGGLCGEVKNFLPQRVQFVNPGVGDFYGTVGVDAVVGWNNSTMSPDFDIMQYAAILAEIDVSERLNVLFSRFLRIPKVADKKEKAAVEQSIQDIIDGRITAVQSDNVCDILTDRDVDNKFLDLVDVKEVDKLQYLNQYRDNVIKRFFLKYGQGMQTTSKLAQQTTDELHGADTVAMIIPNQRLYYRQKWAREVNDMFGTNITYDFSECWKEQREEMLETYSNGLTEKFAENADTKPTDIENEVNNDDKNE